MTDVKEKMVWKQYDTVFVRYEDYIIYCKAACLSLDGRGYD